VYDEIVIENVKNKDGNKRIFYMNFHLGCVGM